MSQPPATVLTFDLETTGVNVNEDRIVQSYLALIASDGTIVMEQEWLVDPGIPIPDGAAEVHGYRNDGPADAPLNYTPNATPAEVVEQVTTAILGVTQANPNVPLVLYNAAFDLSMLEAERLRHAPHVPKLPLGETPEDIAQPPYVIDPMVIWKHVDKYRRGKRTLRAAAEAFGVQVDPERLHDARYDVWLTAMVAHKILSTTQATVQQLDRSQRAWRHEQQTSLAAYFRKNGKIQEAATVSTEWPRQTIKAGEQA